MRKNNIIELSSRETRTDSLSELLLSGAQKLIYQAVEAELSGFLDGFSECRTPSAHAGVVRNGYLPERELQTGLGPVTIKILDDPNRRKRMGTPARQFVGQDRIIKRACALLSTHLEQVVG